MNRVVMFGMNVRDLALHHLRQIRDGEMICQKQGRGVTVQIGLLGLDEVVIAQSEAQES